MRLRLNVGGDAQLTTRDGTVIGQLETVTVNLDLAAIRAISDAPRGTIGGNVVDVQNDKSTTLPSSPIEDATTLDQGSFLPDPVDETWNLYVTLMERPRAVLTPKVRKWIRDAHEAVGVEMTQQAIRGLAASDYHRDKGYVGIEHAIRAKQNETIEGRVAFMAAKAQTPVATANGPMTVDEWVDHFASADVRRVARESINAIDQMVERPDDDNAQLQGTVATRRLGGNGYRPVVEGGRVVRVERM